jgi:F-type H+-transporting ATPase subunit delta
MKGVRAAIRYAKALMQLAQDNKSIDAVVSDVKMIYNLINQSDDLRMLLSSPLIKSDKKQSILTSLFNGKVNDLTLKFIQLVVEQNREGSLAVIADEFITIFNEKNNIAKVSLTTAAALDDKSREMILNTIKEKYKFSEIQLEESVDSELLGGMIMRIGDKQMDASIRGQLRKIENELVQA